MASPRRKQPRASKPSPAPSKSENPAKPSNSWNRSAFKKPGPVASNSMEDDVHLIGKKMREIELHRSADAELAPSKQSPVEPPESNLASGGESGSVSLNDRSASPSSDATSPAPSVDKIVYTARAPAIYETVAIEQVCYWGDMPTDISPAEFRASFISRPIARTPLDDSGSGMESPSPQGGRTVRPDNFWSKKPKKATPQAILQMSDDELQEKALSVWNNDREKKKARKLQHEEDRRLGVLGDWGDVPPETSLVDKYPRSLTMSDLIREVDAFCLGSEKTLVFPPLDQDSRRQLHQFAYRIGLDSKSRGFGARRFPVLTKPADFDRPSKSDLRRAQKLVRRIEFLRSDIRAEKKAKVAPQAGEVIGQEWAQMSTMKGTKAKAMMERMGWKEGDALGSETNKGIAEPIQQVYRYSKAGLG